jgi:transposase-like protein
MNPESLLQATRLFSDPNKAHEYLTNLRFPDGVVPCPHCQGTDLWFLANQRRWKCKGCRKQFSIKVGTIFEDSPLGLDKWLIAVWLIVNAKNGISSCELARGLEVTQKTAWFMLHRIRTALHGGSFDKFSGHVEADETYIGGKARNMHLAARQRRGFGGYSGGITGKTAIMAVLERGGKVHAKVVANRDRKTLHREVKSAVEPGSNLYTDAWKGYNNLGDWYQHQVVDHAEKYVDGLVHTNGMENFWSLLKRGLGGTYISVEPFHLFRYLDEQVFRFNERHCKDGERFLKAVASIVGKRLTYSELTGKVLAAGGNA